MNVAESLLELLPEGVVLLGWPLGSKGTPKRWGHLRAADMTPDYLKGLDGGNIGVAFGKVSNDLIGIDIDDDDFVEPFLKVNPWLKDTLQTHGARGRVFWLQMAGSYPAETIKLKLAPKVFCGEWRAGKNSQSIIHGRHPDGHDYTIVNKAKVLRVAFTDIVWPSEIINPPTLNPELLELKGVKESDQKLGYEVKMVKTSEETIEAMLHSNIATHATHATQLPSYTVTNAVCVCGGLFQTIEDIVQYSLPSTKKQNHDSLWNLSRGVLNLELVDGKSSPEKLTQIFDRWYLLAMPHLDKDQSRDRYFLEFMQAYANAKIPLGEDGVTEAWKRAQQKPLPPEALAVFTDHNPRMVVALCRELQIVWGDEPFFLSCRKLASLLEKETHMTTSRWLTALCAMGFLKEVVKGTRGENGKASSYRYLKSLS